MMRYLRNGALMAAFLGVGFASAAAPVASATPAKNEYKPDQVIIMKEPGKPDRRCVIITAKKGADGMTTYQVKALDNGEVMTILDRAPTPVTKTPTQAPPVAAKPAPAEPAAINGFNLPADVNPRSDTDLPRAKPRTVDPLFTPPVPSSPKAPVANVPPVQRLPQPVAEKPRTRLVGKTEKPAAPCNTCTTPAPMKAIVNAPAKPIAEPPMARGPVDPINISHGPQIPDVSPLSRPAINEPAPLTIYHAPPDPIQQARAQESERITALKDKLQTALRPSERMAAVEQLCAPSWIQEADVRAAVMLAAQDDPAGCVRAACVRAMSRIGVRDQAFMTLLVAAQSDKDASVREEANYAMQRATRR